HGAWCGSGNCCEMAFGNRRPRLTGQAGRGEQPRGGVTAERAAFRSKGGPYWSLVGALRWFRMECPQGACGVLPLVKCDQIGYQSRLNARSGNSLPAIQIAPSSKGPSKMKASRTPARTRSQVGMDCQVNRRRGFDCSSGMMCMAKSLSESGGTCRPGGPQPLRDPTPGCRLPDGPGWWGDRRRRRAARPGSRRGSTRCLRSRRTALHRSH
ncbi:MAG: hypothetical protein K0Q72_1165, partial [Armatimonadetes bacterium]|nr:hypothetical protein [Armatimonadota bacterium]